MPRDVSLSDSKCWNGGHEWVKADMSLIVHFIEHFETFISEDLDLLAAILKMYLFQSCIYVSYHFVFVSDAYLYIVFFSDVYLYFVTFCICLIPKAQLTVLTLYG